MYEISTKLPPAAWRRIRRFTGVLTLVSVAVSVIASNIILEVFSQGINLPGLAAAVVMPALLGGPMMFYLSVRHEQLRHANRQLQVMAETDWLTACLNRGAFTRKVEADLVSPASAGGTGALLVVDADDFKRVNDRFGHQAGDEALRRIADVIRANVRKSDLVGRLGGEEFGVYLAEASHAKVDEIAERVRHAIAALVFTPSGMPCPLSVSIGGISFSKPAAYEDIYRLADERLYMAKSNGRDCIALTKAA
ncbi:GGDEF domain-containing protein [Devosia geojensis]|uniref:GGDEF domain-containing protein n=1 Tax=Devosia geojensis TaxID=443610 RepID=UPI000A6ED510|nr:GGDEF domain-containing protein [Devosia geojensis]